MEITNHGKISSQCFGAVRTTWSWTQSRLQERQKTLRQSSVLWPQRRSSISKSAVAAIEFLWTLFSQVQYQLHYWNPEEDVLSVASEGRWSLTQVVITCMKGSHIICSACINHSRIWYRNKTGQKHTAVNYKNEWENYKKALPQRLAQQVHTSHIGHSSNFRLLLQWLEPEPNKAVHWTLSFIQPDSSRIINVNVNFVSHQVF